MRTLRTAILSILLALTALPAGARADSLSLAYTVRGVVVDARSGERLPAVNIRVAGRNFATVSNSDGAFVIKSDEPISVLTCSYVGYQTLSLPVGGPDVVARMVPESYRLDPSSIISGDPLEIVRAAMNLVRENYPSRPELLKCFYRETLQKRGRYISVAEAVSRVYKSSYYGSDFGDRVALDKSRIVVSQKQRDTISVKLMGGPTIVTTADLVKNRDMLLGDILAGLYDLEMGAPAYIGDRLQFVIHFAPAAVHDFALFEGTLFIDREKLFVTRVEMALDVSDPALATRHLLRKKPNGLRFTPKEVSFVISYRYDGRVARMEYYRSVFRFNCDWRKRMFATAYTVVNETVVTDVIVPCVPIPRDEQFRTTDFMSDKARQFLDPEFWKDYNIIEPSESLEHAAKRLQK